MEIPPSRAVAFAKIFQDEGLDVSWDAPLEKRTGGGTAEAVQVVYFLVKIAGEGLVAGTTYDAAKRAVRRIREHFPSMEVTVEDDETDGED